MTFLPSIGKGRQGYTAETAGDWATQEFERIGQAWGLAPTNDPLMAGSSQSGDDFRFIHAHVQYSVNWSIHIHVYFRLDGCSISSMWGCTCERKDVKIWQWALAALASQRCQLSQPTTFSSSTPVGCLAGNRCVCVCVNRCPYKVELWTPMNPISYEMDCVWREPIIWEYPLQFRKYIIAPTLAYLTCHEGWCKMVEMSVSSATWSNVEFPAMATAMGDLPAQRVKQWRSK